MASVRRCIRKGASAASDPPTATLHQEGEEGAHVLLHTINYLGKEKGAPNSSRWLPHGRAAGEGEEGAHVLLRAISRLGSPPTRDGKKQRLGRGGGRLMAALLSERGGMMAASASSAREGEEGDALRKKIWAVRVLSWSC
jgi:hypothetical protein